MRPNETDDFQAALSAAATQAQRDRAPQVGTEHLLLGALRQTANPAVWLLASKGITWEIVYQNYECSLRNTYYRPRDAGRESIPTLTAAAGRALQQARALAPGPADVAHLLVALLSEKGIGNALLMWTFFQEECNQLDTAALARSIRLLFTQERR
jgi:ATP-dependent Clp protease ATP-binding subunit ClpA